MNEEEAKRICKDIIDYYNDNTGVYIEFEELVAIVGKQIEQVDEIDKCFIDKEISNDFFDLFMTCKREINKSVKHIIYYYRGNKDVVIIINPQRALETVDFPIYHINIRKEGN
jgi:5-methylcytosine-specific restriction endonuclease McrBC regulatory subunit McrC